MSLHNCSRAHKKTLTNPVLFTSTRTMRRSGVSLARHQARMPMNPNKIGDHKRRLFRTSSVVNQPSNGSNASPWRPELVVFDQYGTVVNIHTVWEPWVNAISQRLESATGLDLREKLYKCLDICHITRKVRHGVLGEGNSWQIKQSLQILLQSEGLSSQHAQRVLQENWEDFSPSSPVQHIHQTRSIFEQIKATGAKIALCSSDDRLSTMETLQNSNLIGLVDHVTCGDDTDARTPKYRVSEICQQLGIGVEGTVVIGDSIGDMEMGREANVALNIGVLSGIGTRLNLSGIADIVANDISEATNYLKTLDENKIKEISTNRTATKDTDNQASLVIFDKDGTLLCFHSMWTPWANEFIHRLESATGLELRDKVLMELGYNMNQNKWRPAVFTEGTDKQSREAVVRILEEKGMESSEAMETVCNTWPHGDHSRDSKSLKVFDKPVSIFKTLQSLGIKVAVCTSDSRRGTEVFLHQQNVMDHVDMIVCGDDPDNVPKPNPHNALRICDTLGVSPSASVIVGDTSADMVMGRDAKLGATVAVLSGVGDIEHLSPDADYVVPSIGHVIDVVTSQERRQYARDIYRKELELVVT